MSEPSKKVISLRPEPAPADDDKMIVQLSVAELRTLIREEIGAAGNGNGQHSPALLTAEELAKQMKVPVSWVYEQSRQGAIPTHRIGKYIRFDLDEVMESQRRKETS